MMTSSGAGEPLPMMLIIKCSTATTEQHRVKVVKNMQEEVPFNAWTYGMWERTLELPKRGGGITTVKHARPYLLDPEHGHLLYAHHKAWNDSAGEVTAIVPGSPVFEYLKRDCLHSCCCHSRHDHVRRARHEAMERSSAVWCDQAGTGVG